MQERDSAVAASVAARDVRESLSEANADVERLTTQVNELYQANLTQVEHFCVH